MPAFDWIAGDLSLDFVNSADWPPEGLSGERIKSYDDLLAWSREAGLLEKTASLEKAAAAAPAEEQRTVDLARKVRAILRDLFCASRERRLPDQRRLAQFNAALSAALDRLELAPRGRAGLAWSWLGPGEELEWPLWPVLWAAARLLTSGDAKLVRWCSQPRCRRLYLDRSRRGNRKWCSMKECGNREKARRHYARRKKRGPGDPASPARGGRPPSL